MSDGGKGSQRRPAQVSDAQYAERWDQIFHRKIDRVNAARDLVDSTDDMPNCKDDPRAPHGFMRNASLNADRYVCECEFWLPDQITDAAEIRRVFEGDEE